MTHGQLINVAIGAHSAVLTLSVLAFFKYGFRSSEFRTWVEDTSKTNEIVVGTISGFAGSWSED